MSTNLGRYYTEATSQAPSTVLDWTDKVDMVDTLEARDINKLAAAIINLQKQAPSKVLEKCAYCGHWGAVQCACKNCGAPIDPRE